MDRTENLEVSYEEIVASEAAHNFMLNVYRYNENNRALRLAKFAERVKSREVKGLVAKHFSDEARHALLFTKRLLDEGGDIYELPPEIDYIHKLERNGIGITLDRLLQPEDLTDDEVLRFLVADEYLEERGVDTLSRHLAASTDKKTRTLIEAVLHDEKGHASYIHETLESLADSDRKDRIQALYADYGAKERAVQEEQSRALQAKLAELMNSSGVRARSAGSAG